MLKIIVGICIGLFIQGCGQKGALYLPKPPAPEKAALNFKAHRG